MKRDPLNTQNTLHTSKRARTDQTFHMLDALTSNLTMETIKERALEIELLFNDSDFKTLYNFCIQEKDKTNSIISKSSLTDKLTQQAMYELETLQKQAKNTDQFLAEIHKRNAYVEEMVSHSKTMKAQAKNAKNGYKRAIEVLTLYINASKYQNYEINPAELDQHIHTLAKFSRQILSAYVKQILDNLEVVLAQKPYEVVFSNILLKELLSQGKSLLVTQYVEFSNISNHDPNQYCLGFTALEDILNSNKYKIINLVTLNTKSAFNTYLARLAQHHIEVQYTNDVCYAISLAMLNNKTIDYCINTFCTVLDIFEDLNQVENIISLAASLDNPDMLLSIFKHTSKATRTKFLAKNSSADCTNLSTPLSIALDNVSNMNTANIAKSKLFDEQVPANCVNILIAYGALEFEPNIFDHLCSFHEKLLENKIPGSVFGTFSARQQALISAVKTIEKLLKKPLLLYRNGYSLSFLKKQGVPAKNLFSVSSEKLIEAGYSKDDVHRCKQEAYAVSHFGLRF